MTQTQQEPARPRPGRARTVQLLFALLLGVCLGLLLRRFGQSGVSVAQALGQIGQLWLNGLRMTLIPLIFCLTTAGAADISRTASGGVVVRTAVGAFLSLLLLGSILGTLAALVLMALWPVTQIDQVASAVTTTTPSLVSEFISFIPANPFAAAAEGAVAPLIVFAAFLGAAIARIREDWTALLLVIMHALSAAMLLVVGWVLRLAPVGVFFLLMATVATTGTSAAKGLLQYGILASIVTAAGVAVAQIIGLTSGIGAARFAKAALQPQTVAATTQSSSACLPVLLEAATTLELPAFIIDAIMPLAVTTFRFGNVVSGVATGLIGAALFGVHPSSTHILIAIGVGILTNIGSVGVPGAAVLLAAWGPIYLALGVPLEALTLFIAIITVPDILITIANVTGDLAVTSLIATLLRKRGIQG